MGSGWLLLLLFGTITLFWSVITGLGCLALHEYAVMMDKGGAVAVKPPRYVFLFGLLPVIGAFSGRPDPVMAGLFLALLLLIAISIIHLQPQEGFEFLARHGWGVLFIGFCAAHLVLLRSLPDGNLWLLYLTAVTVASDSGAYYVGRSMGRTKLCPAISPGKTVAGGVGGLIAGGLAGVIIAYCLPLQVDLLALVFVSLALVCLGVLGDLVESIIKRAADVKDSGRLLPGHGGLLDRIDSLLLAAPVLYYLLHFQLLSG